MISNPSQRDDVHGTAASASAENYLARRQGNLKRSSDGFRAPTLSTDPRRPFESSGAIDPPLRPYAYNPRPPETVVGRHPPRNFVYLRPASLGAPRVGFPDAERTGGKLQSSGQAWGRLGEGARAQLTPAVDGRNAPPSHSLGVNAVGSPSSRPVKWTPGRTVTVRGRKPGSSTAE